MDSSDFGEFGPHAACHFGEAQMGELHTQAAQMFQQLFLLARKVLSVGFGHSWAGGRQLPHTLMASSTSKDTSDNPG